MARMKQQAFPWKGSYRRLPTHILAALADITTNLITVGATKKVDRADIAAGLYAHLGLTIVEGA
jgi:hypothetical protein